MTAKKMTYFEMASEAITTLKERTGSSNHAIKAYITTTFPTVEFQAVSTTPYQFEFLRLLTVEIYVCIFSTS